MLIFMFTKMYNEHGHSNYVCQWAVGLMGCRTNGLSNQWVVGPMGCRTNGLSNHREVTDHRRANAGVFSGGGGVGANDNRPSERLLIAGLRKASVVIVFFFQFEK